MKITPLDIRRKEFKRSVRGYSDEEVDIFLDEVADEFERLFQENMELQDRMQRMDEQIAIHAQLKDALEKTLISAQLQAEELRSNAHKERELILRDAEMKARGIVNDSYGETHKTQQALVQLKMLEEDFRIKFRSLLEGYLRLLTTAPLAATTAETEAAAELDADTAEDTVEPAPVPAAVVPAPEPPAPVVPGPAAEPALQQETAAPEPAQPVVPAPVPDTPFVAQTPPLPAATASLQSSPPLWAPPAAAPPARPLPLRGEENPYLEPTVEATMDSDTLETGWPGNRPEEAPRGFFFGRRTNDVDDTFQTEDGPKKDRSRDFEW